MLRSSLATWAVALACVVPPALVAQDDAGKPSKPANVLVLLVDDLRDDALGAAGNPHARTPNLDALAEDSARFENAYCFGSIHGAVCQPSRAMILSGRTLWRTDMALRGMPTLPEHLRKQGYDTFATGKWHNGRESFERVFGKGDAAQVMLGGMSNHEKVPVRQLGEDGKLGEQGFGEKFSSELFTDATVDFLESRKPDGKPFFGWVAFTAPHDPRQPPEEYRRMFEGDKRPPLPPNFLPQHPFDNGRLVLRDEVLAGWPRDPEVIRDQLGEYYGLISHLDAQIGRILDTLKATGLDDDTIVVFAADHGLAMGSHGLLGKQNLYEHSMGAPLWFRGPGIEAGAREELAYLHDIEAIVCSHLEFRGLPGSEGHPYTLDGGKGPIRREALFTTYENKIRAVRDARYKLIRYPLANHEQLFDLDADPHEMNDLIGDEAYRVIADNLRVALSFASFQFGDPHPLSVEGAALKRPDLSGRERKPDRWQPEWIIEKYFR